MAPIIVPIKNVGIIVRIISLYSNKARPKLEPNWTTPCTGINTAGGINKAIVANVSIPPPRPTEAVIKLPKKEIVQSSINSQLDTPEPCARKSIKPTKFYPTY